MIPGIESVVEKKYCDKDISTTCANTNGGGSLFNVFAPVCALPIGNGECERRGRQIKVTHVSVRGDLIRSSQGFTPPGGTVAGAHVTLYLILDTKVGATVTVPNWSEFLQIGVGSDPVDDFRNLKYTERYKVLAVKHASMNYQAAYVVAGTSYVFGVHEPFEINVATDFIVNYNNSGNPATAESIIDNNLIVFGVCDNGITIGIDGLIRFRYYDL